MAIKAFTSMPALYSRSEDNLSSLMQMDDDADAQKVIMLDLPVLYKIIVNFAHIEAMKIWECCNTALRVPIIGHIGDKKLQGSICWMKGFVLSHASADLLIGA